MIWHYVISWDFLCYEQKFTQKLHKLKSISLDCRHPACHHFFKEERVTAFFFKFSTFSWQNRIEGETRPHKPSPPKSGKCHETTSSKGLFAVPRIKSHIRRPKNMHQLFIAVPLSPISRTCLGNWCWLAEPPHRALSSHTRSVTASSRARLNPPDKPLLSNTWHPEMIS